LPPVRILVTGGGGFIGSNLVERLLRDGHDVRVIDNFATGRRENLLPFVPDAELVEGDVRSYERVHKAMEDCEVVLHQAALPSVPRSIQDPLTSDAVNVTGTLNVLLTARDAGVRRVVFASSSSAYGSNPTLPKSEDLVPSPISPYAVAKLAGEHYCRAFTDVYGLETVALRYFNVFGPRQDPLSQYSAVVPKFITAVLNGSSPLVHGDGSQSRDFTYIDNVVEANLLAMDAGPEAVGEVFNIACGTQVSLNELLDLIGQVTGREVAAEYGSARPGDVLHSSADISKAQGLLGYVPHVGLQEGLMRTTADLAGAAGGAGTQLAS
jgi:UDP-glucose 4-epimerase